MLRELGEMKNKVETTSTKSLITPISCTDQTAAINANSTCFPVANPLESFWQTETHPLSDHRSTAELPVETDIVIIGAGFAGVSTAHHLVREFKGDLETAPSITILEARAACSGATGRNGGHLRPDFYGHIPKYIEQSGPRAGAEIAEFEIANLRALKRFIEEEDIDCDFTLARSIDVCGVKGVQSRVPLSLPGHYGPFKLVMHLVQKLLESKFVNLQTYTPVHLVQSDKTGVFFVNTARGHVHTGKVIYANNAYVSGTLPEYAKNTIIPCKGICCRIAVPDGTMPPLLNNSYINRANDHTLSYLVPRPDGSIVVGGAAARFKSFREQWYDNVDDGCLIDAAKAYYDNYMLRTYLGWEDTGAKVNTIWTGVMGYSYDSNPHIGQVPSKESEFIIAGFNGHGMPVIWLAAQELAP
ncbi:FAD dependent oxidoreductase [Penicillium waksmanii]|uniref:FAD dependent oxidoreductase n=1 Tax=Penicillium waksmanii TaxID=69791 RepID=UPI0025476918|nr:FAD dependent oxidoreductase [Penicillium waksmanii]KAJ5976423.1 FAD dependent oxidoreductase [Penicillium waksmanii]